MGALTDMENGSECVHNEGTPSPSPSPSPSSLSTTSSPSPLSLEYVQCMNEALANKPLEDVLRWCCTSLPGLIQVSSFGSTGMVIVHALHKLGLKLPTVFLDTLYHFEETLEHAREVQRTYALDLHWYRCRLAITREEFERVFKSTDMWISEPHKYEQLTKVEPLERALSEMNVGAWISGRRRDQGGLRDDLQILEIDEADGRIKVNPLAHWTKDAVWNYLKREGVPYNPLFDKSYTSIGDSVTTSKNEDPDKGERSGRFFQTAGKTECGIHNRRKQAPPSMDVILSVDAQLSTSSPAQVV